MRRYRVRSSTRRVRRSGSATVIQWPTQHSSRAQVRWEASRISHRGSSGRPALHWPIPMALRRGSARASQMARAPTPMVFLAQVNLSVMAREAGFDPSLPDSGMLWALIDPFAD
nr:DUF1963 domain-containing protein [Rhizobium aethiopicum]